jgi:hypothetical protein
MKSTAKEVKDKINEHILSYFHKDYGFMDADPIVNLKAQLGVLGYLPTDYAKGKYLAEGGTFLIYYEEQRNFLNGLGINPENKEYPDHKVFEQYCHLIGRQVAELVK